MKQSGADIYHQEWETLLTRNAMPVTKILQRLWMGRRTLTKLRKHDSSKAFYWFSSARGKDVCLDAYSTVRSEEILRVSDFVKATALPLKLHFLLCGQTMARYFKKTVSLGFFSCKGQASSTSI
ncbi:unnamed protein product [Caretta caretta]